MSSIDPWSPVFNLSRQASPPATIPRFTEQKDQRTSTASPSSFRDSDDRSDASLHSTTPSSVSSSPPPPLATMNPTNYGYEFVCPFECVGCQLTFHPTEIDAFVSHSASHFLNHRPPPKTICVFCPQTFENSDNRVANWNRRMRHIADHYRRFEQYENSRPDFFVIEYMRKKHIISDEDYKWSTGHTERPDCDGLVEFGYKTEEAKRREARAQQEIHNLEKEDRHRKRHKYSKGMDKGKGYRTK
jgi:hypothetical protein